MSYQEGQKVLVVVSRERGGYVSFTASAEIVSLGKDRVTVKFKDGTTKRVAYSRIQAAPEKKFTGFTQGFDKFACDGDSITCIEDGFDCKATIEHDDDTTPPDQRQDGFWPSINPLDAGYIGDDSEAHLAEAQATAEETMRAWKNDEWWYVGIVVTVSKGGVRLTRDYSNALWGIDCNRPEGDNSYLRTVANELLPEAIVEAKKRAKEIVDQLTRRENMKSTSDAPLGADGYGR